MKYLPVVMALLAISLASRTEAKPSERVATNTLTPCEVLQVSGNPEYPPFLWRDARNPERLTGAAVRLLETALVGTGIRIEARYTGPWSRAQEEARVGRIDMLAGAFMTDERKTWMDYVVPAMMAMENVIFVRRGQDFPFERWDDLKGRRGDTLIKNSFGQAFDTFAREQLDIEEVRSIEFAFERLRLGRTDYVIYELFQGLAIAQARRFSDEITALTPAISSEGLYFTVSKKSACGTPAFIGYLNNRMQDIVLSGLPQQFAEEALILWREQAPHVDL